jgi:hypothetical protein
MEFTLDIGAQPKLVYQDTKNSSPNWRQTDRILHPLTENQFLNKFRVGDRVKMRVIYPETKGYINATIVNIVGYHGAQQWLGQYNIDNAFKGVPFSRVLVLRP